MGTTWGWLAPFNIFAITLLGATRYKLFIIGLMIDALIRYPFDFVKREEKKDFFIMF